MSDSPVSIRSFAVSIEKFRKGNAMCTVWVHLRGGERSAAHVTYWPSGAPTPHQLELLLAAVSDELQTLVLTECGVQGVLLAEGNRSDS